MAELASQPTSIQSVYSWFRGEKLFVNRRYQRKLVWTLEEKQKLVESILKKYPIPAILLAERENDPGTYEIIDGLQRLHAIMSYIETSFSLPNGNYFDLKQFPTATQYSQNGYFDATESSVHLSQKEISTFLDYSLALSIMRNATDDEINDVFGRINTYGHRLSDQERRQAGVENEFSIMVRQLSCSLRGDVSSDVLPLHSMPSISIDLPKTKQGYEVQADEVFWVRQGILRSTDLRDSLDEQCIADISACIVGGSLIERSKDALDSIYSASEGTESDRIEAALEVYGKSKFVDEFTFCVQQILKVCAEDKDEKLRDIVFKQRTTNAFPSVFAVILIAFYELMIVEEMQVSDAAGVKNALRDLSERIDTTRRATSPDERRKNVDTIKGLMQKSFVKEKIPASEIYNSHTTIDIESVIRRSEIELGNYELKQGLYPISENSKINSELVRRILGTISAIANIGPSSSGKIVIGVTDKTSDATKIKKLDSIEPIKVGKRHVVGIAREAKRASISVEKYFSDLKNEIKKSSLSSKLKDDILSNIDYNSFFGLGVIVISIPPQKEVSYLGEDLYFREGDSTEKAITPKQIASIVQRF